MSSAQGTWEPDRNERAERLIDDIVDETGSAAVRSRAWRELFALIAPSLDEWCRSSSVLWRSGLAHEDSQRATFVRAVERIVRKEYSNLRAYRAHREQRRQEGTLGATPFEAWLRRLVRYAASDEVERHLATRRAFPAGGAGTIEGLGNLAHARRTGPITGLERKERSAAMRAAVGVLADDQKAALVQRIEGASYDEIATTLELEREQAYRLVRSAKAVLRRSMREAAKGKRRRGE